jgi:hypothetical protein
MDITRILIVMATIHITTVTLIPITDIPTGHILIVTITGRTQGRGDVSP